jgi:hypothetical protein
MFLEYDEKLGISILGEGAGEFKDLLDMHSKTIDK